MWRFDCRVKLAACLRVLADKSLAPRPKFDRCATRHKLVSPLTPFPLTVLVRWIGCLRTPPFPLFTQLWEWAHPDILLAFAPRPRANRMGSAVCWRRGRLLNAGPPRLPFDSL